MTSTPTWFANVNMSLQRSLRDRDYPQVLADLRWMASRIHALIDGTLIAEDRRAQRLLRKFYRACLRVVDFRLLGHDHPAADLRAVLRRVGGLV